MTTTQSLLSFTHHAARKGIGILPWDDGCLGRGALSVSRCLQKVPSVKRAAAWSAHRDQAYALQRQQHAKPLLLRPVLSRTFFPRAWTRCALGPREWQLVRHMQFRFLPCMHTLCWSHTQRQHSVWRSRAQAEPVRSSLLHMSSGPTISQGWKPPDYYCTEDDFRVQDPSYQCCGLRVHHQEAAASS